MKFEHSLISNFHKEGLVAPVVMLFMTCQGERYCVDGFGTGHVGVGSGDR